METEQVIKRGTLDTQPLRTADTAGRRELNSDQADVDGKRGAVGYQSAAGTQLGEDSAPLFEEGALKNFRSRWRAIQIGFVDNPGGAVKQADELVAAVMERIAEVFGDERANLEQAWANGDDVSTEDLRVALRRYRSFFDRLLSV